MPPSYTNIRLNPVTMPKAPGKQITVNKPAMNLGNLIKGLQILGSKKKNRVKPGAQGFLKPTPLPNIRKAKSKGNRNRRKARK
jgi:hypothetical protein